MRGRVRGCQASLNLLNGRCSSSHHSALKSGTIKSSSGLICSSNSNPKNSNNSSSSTTASSSLRNQRRSFQSAAHLSLGRNGLLKQRQYAAAALPETSSNSGSVDSPKDNSNNSSDDELKRLFDENRAPSSSSSSSFLSALTAARASATTGLFNVPALTSPQASLTHARRALTRANAIVSRVCAPNPSQHDLERTVRRLDRLSDEVCSVVDAAEVIRNIHPDKEWVEAADEVHAQLSSYLNQLNTHQGLYEALKHANSIPTIRTHWSPTEKRVADLLLSDFEKSGIHMTPSSRNKFVRLHDDILRVGHAFTLRAHPGTTEIEVEDPWNRLRGVRSDLVRTLVRTNANNGKQYARIPTGGYIAQTVMRTARDDDVRRRLFMAMNSATKEQVEGMDKMLRLRAELGQLLGKSSYGQVYLEDKMAKDPEHVMKFLNALSTAHRPRANQEVQLLRNLKRLHSSPPLPASAPLPPLEAWDRQFYAQFLPQPPTDAVFPAMHMPLAHAGGSHRRPLLANPQTGVTLGTAISGLSRLLHLLYGIQLVPSDSKPGELWHPSVRRLDAVHDTQGRVGTIYCDLLSRPDGSRKYENPAHFTVQCSRRVDWDFEDPIVEPERGEEVGEREGREGRYKLPVVVLVANFRQGGKLSWVEVETVFHEMGHAVHSMLARTDFQHVAGTRCQMDFVEVPSTLMEFLLRHIGIPGAMAPPIQRDPLDFQTQVRLAILDQAYHSPLALQQDFNSDTISAQIQTQHDAIPHVPGTAWQVQFGHLFSYGCGYYTYLWSRLWAGRIFQSMFRGKTQEEMRENGEKLRREVLVWGGGRDGWESLSKLGVLREGEGEEGVKVVDLDELGL